MNEKINTIDEISEYIFLSKYSRYDEKLGRRETWKEAVGRLEKMHLKKYSFLDQPDKDKIRWAFDLVRDKVVVPSMRSLQFGGKAIEAKNERMYNCSVRHIDSIRSFAEVFYLLLCGCGVGLGLSKYFLNRLPDLVNKDDKTGTVVTYVVSDTIEGWADSIEALLMCYFKNTAYTGRKIVFDYSKIRPEGSILKTSGGKAPGYKGLKNCHRNIKELLDHVIEYRGQVRLKSVDAYDILMHSADAVLSGGVRRSSTSVIFDKDDIDMINAKTMIKVDKVFSFTETGMETVGGQTHKIFEGRVAFEGKKYDLSVKEYELSNLIENKMIFWKHLFPQRARSNNSVLLLREEIKDGEFKDILERTKQFGEPGFVFGSHKWQLFNPCFSGDTMVAVADGRLSVSIKQLSDEGYVGPIYTIKDGNVSIGTCSRVWKTKENAELVKVFLDDGTYFRCTPEHKIMLKTGEYRSACDLEKDDLLMSFGAASRDISVLKVLSLDVREDVYDLTVDETHNFAIITSANNEGVFVHNCFEISFLPVSEDGVCSVQFCNLSSINGRLIDSKEKFKQAVEAETIIGTLQAGYTDFPYLGNSAKHLTEEEALLGCSITGLMDNPDILLDAEIQKELSLFAAEVNKEWAKKININYASRIGCLKPEGTASLVLGTGSGIHPHHARRYFRRVTANRHETVYRYFKKVNPKLCEPSVWSANKTDDMISFPIEVSEKSMVKADLSALRHLEIIRSTQKNWVKEGSIKNNRKPIENNVSCTVVVKDNEWADVSDFLFKNRDYFAAVSLLPYGSDKIYPQAPMEAIVDENDEKRWSEIVSGFNHVDYRNMNESEDTTKLNQEMSCFGGSCEII
jgi:hypothetical protein